MKTNKKTIAIFSVAALLLAIPLIAMQFTNEVNWTGSEFAMMGILLFTTAFLIDLAMKRMNSLNKKILVIAMVLLTFFLVWAELAVGIFGTPFSGN